MRPRNRLVRLARALSGETQKDFADKTGVHFILLAQYEQDQVEPGPENLERLLRGVGGAGLPRCRARGSPGTARR